MTLPFDPDEYKPGLLEPIDMSVFVIERGGHKITPYDGESVYLEPYVDSATEQRLWKAYEELGESPDAVEAFELICELLADSIIGWNLTDKTGKALPQPDTAEDVKRLPSAAVLYLMHLTLGIEPEGEGPSASGATQPGSSKKDRRRGKRKSGN